MKKLNLVMLLILPMIFMASCKKKELASPVINEVHDITENSAKINFDVSANKNSSVSEHGIVWGIAAHVTTDDNKIIVGEGQGNFSIQITGLNTSTTYFVRAYAINSEGIAYSAAITFTTGIIDITTPGPVIDFDGFEYETIVLGNGQEWMTNNLRNLNYANGDPIPNVQDAEAWGNLSSGAWVHYNNDSQYENPYGKLYNWYTVNDSRGICPEGWHVPTVDDFDELIAYSGGIENAGALFNNELGGERWTNMGMFNYGGQVGFWWSSTPMTAKVTSSLGTLMGYANPIPNKGLSVRCIKN
jgi:uncharacterized protein (TIGR02145 family)